MYPIVFLLFGLTVGVVARWMVSRARHGGWVGSMVVGTLGAFLGGFLGQALGLFTEGQPAGFPLSMLCAVLLVGAYHPLARRRALRLRHRSL